jgi:hypothetical protein
MELQPCTQLRDGALTDARVPVVLQDILIEALKAAIILAILERLFFTRNSSWVRRCRACACQTLVRLWAAWLTACAAPLAFFCTDSWRSTSIISVCRRCCSRSRP